MGKACDSEKNASSSHARNGGGLGELMLVTQAAAIRDIRQRTGLSERSAIEAAALMSKNPDGTARHLDGCRWKVLDRDVEDFIYNTNNPPLPAQKNKRQHGFTPALVDRIQREGVRP
jgi:hypothetical protein